MSTGGGAEHLRKQAAKEARMAADEVYQAILARAPEHDIDPTLDRVRAVCELLGDPQKAYRVVHLTGTNGKTSTSRMVERLLREHGLRTGRFTSPHLSRVTERIAIDGEPISDEKFVEVWQDVAPYVHLVDQGSIEKGEPRLSFFEVFTVMAFAAFADAPVDVAVIEVGLGGTWDSTNVADGEVAVITPIALDHERFLGHTLVEIASEKSGIIKDGATVVHRTPERGRRGRAARRGRRAGRARRPRGCRHPRGRPAGRGRRPADQRCRGSAARTPRSSCRCTGSSRRRTRCWRSRPSRRS